MCCVLCAILLQSQRACCKTYVVYMIHTWLNCSLYTQKADTRHTICQWIQSFKLIHISTFSYIHKEAYMSSIIDHVYKTFVQHIITSFDIYRHADISTLFITYIQHSTSTYYLLYSTFISNFVELIRCSSWNLTYVIRHYLTFYYFIW